MNEIHFFAETNDGNMTEFYAITFMFDKKLYGVSDPIIMRNRIKLANAEDYIATYKLNSSKSGMLFTGYYRPTLKDIPIFSLRRIWNETWPYSDSSIFPQVV